MTLGTHWLFNTLIGGRIATVLAMLIAVIVYGAGILLLGALTEEEMRSLPRGAVLIRMCKKLHLL